jgi:hypothetical protein
MAGKCGYGYAEKIKHLIWGHKTGFKSISASGFRVSFNTSEPQFPQVEND